MKTKLFSFFLALVASAGTMFARTVQIGDLYYDLDTESMTAEVTYQKFVSEDNYSGLTSVNIPSSVTYNSQMYSVTCIGDRAFEGCRGLTSITIPNSVTRIGDYAFEGSSLMSITIPANVTSIGDYTFDGCNLTSVTWNAKKCNRCTFGYDVDQVESFVFGDEVEVIPDRLCSGMAKLTSIIIPNSVTRIGDYAFYGCSSLPVENNIRYADTYLVEAVDKSLPTYIIKEGTKWIGSDAFYECNSLISVTIPNSVTSVGNGAFSRCASLTSIIIPDNVTDIGTGAFKYCISLINVIIPENIASIGQGATFQNCTALTSVQWNAKNCQIEYYDKNNHYCYPPFYNLENITSFSFGNKVQNIPHYLCYGLSNLTNITISNSVTSIEEGAFYGCSGLTSITIPNSVTSIEVGAFYGCSNLVSITIPNSVTSIERYTFSRCSSLTSVNIPNSVTSVGESAFSLCAGLTSIEIPNSVTSIGEYAFCKCSSLASIVIPNSVTSIGIEAFEDCSNLTSVVIPNKVTSVESKTFYGCTKLQRITLGEGITSIASSAFENCTYLIEINAKMALPPIIDATVFSGCGDLSGITCYVPEGSLAYYQKLDVWKEFNLAEKDFSEEDAIETTNNDAAVSIRKELRDGQLFILREGKMYNVQGQEVR